MKPIVDLLLKNLGVLALLLFAALSFAVVLDSRDPVGLLGWLFCVAVVLTAGMPSPCADSESL